MKRTLVRYRNSAFRRFVRKHDKYAPVIFFIGGFIFDTLTLGRIDRIYDLTVLSLHMISLTITLYLFNLAGDGKWRNTFLGGYEVYFPLAIQFFFGGLSSAFVIYFSRSVSFSKTVSFFVILIALLVANEFLKKRISNKYLQFGVYFFISFTFFAFMFPVFMREMNPEIFIFSGLASVACTLVLIILIYIKSPSTRAELQLGKLLFIVAAIYTLINVFYHFRLIPPVPLALSEAIVAHHIVKSDDTYTVTYEPEAWHVFWRDYKSEFQYSADAKVYIFSSVFAPTDLEKSIIHRWYRYDTTKEDWIIVEDIGYEITGGRNNGYRGFTYKSAVSIGLWKVEVITKEELVLGVIDFEIVGASGDKALKTLTKEF